jgi:hypothetical protein
MRAIALILLLAFSLTGHAQTENTSPSAGVVKKSKSGICHAPSSPHYERTKNFTPFKTLDECLKSGGRLPK